MKRPGTVESSAGKFQQFQQWDLGLRLSVLHGLLFIQVHADITAEIIEKCATVISEDLRKLAAHSSQSVRDYLFYTFPDSVTHQTTLLNNAIKSAEQLDDWIIENLIMALAPEFRPELIVSLISFLFVESFSALISLTIL